MNGTNEGMLLFSFLTFAKRCSLFSRMQYFLTYAKCFFLFLIRTQYVNLKCICLLITCTAEGGDEHMIMTAIHEHAPVTLII